MLITKALGAAPGIQYQGVKDFSEVLDGGQAGTVGLIVGEFKRGRTDQPFPVTLDNYRARLGYQPDNLYYIAVQDALNTGFPVVYVQRVVIPNNLDCSPTFITTNYYGGIGGGGGKAGINYQVNGGPVRLAFWEDNLTGGAVEALLRALEHDESEIPFPANHFKFTVLPDPENSELNALKIEGFSESEPGFIYDPMTVRLLRDSTDVGRWWLYDYLFPADQGFVEIHTCGYVSVIPTISCAGATSNVYFSTFSGTFDIEIDGVLYQIGNVSLYDYIQTNFSNILLVDQEDGFYIENIDSVHHRVKLIPNGYTEPSFTLPSDNPTFMQMQDGILVFCLDKKSYFAQYLAWSDNNKIAAVFVDSPPIRIFDSAINESTSFNYTYSGYYARKVYSATMDEFSIMLSVIWNVDLVDVDNSFAVIDINDGSKIVFNPPLQNTMVQNYCMSKDGSTIAVTYRYFSERDIFVYQKNGSEYDLIKTISPLGLEDIVDFVLNFDGSKLAVYYTTGSSSNIRVLDIISNNGFNVEISSLGGNEYNFDSMYWIEDAVFLPLVLSGNTQSSIFIINSLTESFKNTGLFDGHIASVQTDDSYSRIVINFYDLSYATSIQISDINVNHADNTISLSNTKVNQVSAYGTISPNGEKLAHSFFNPNGIKVFNILAENDIEEVS